MSADGSDPSHNALELAVLRLEAQAAEAQLTPRQLAEAVSLGWSAVEYARYIEMDEGQREDFRKAKVESDPTFHEAQARRRRRAFALIRGGRDDAP